MASTYSAFLQSPSSAALAPDAVLNYITTTTSISEPAAILKHLVANAKQVDKIEEKILSTIESTDALCLETQTTLKFKNGGGVYLPGIDENLLDEKVVVFPLTHIVRYDSDKKIQQIRLYWDQGTLLRQVEAIGKTGRNWPIRDGKAQVDAVKKSVQAIALPSSQPAQTSTRNKHMSITATKDPHASLNLFAPRNLDDEPAPRAYDSVLSPRASAKPAPRDYGELFASEETVPKPAAGARSSSPAKAGAQKNYTRNRLHDENAPPDVLSPGGAKKVYEQKYDHFSFGDGEDAPAPKPVDFKRHSKHQSTFSFEDFATPVKVEEKRRPDQERHWGQDVDAPSPSKPKGIPARPDAERHWGGQDDPPSPPRRNLVHAPRRDAKTHFEIADEAPEDDVVKPGATMTRVDNSRRGNDFGAHYTISDDSPANAGPAKKIGSAPRVDQEQHWAFSSPSQEKKIYKTAGNGMGGRTLDLFAETPDTQENKKIYKTAGDGMGGRNTNEKHWWDFGDENEAEDTAPPKERSRGRARPKQQQTDVEF